MDHRKLAIEIATRALGRPVFPPLIDAIEAGLREGERSARASERQAALGDACSAVCSLCRDGVPIDTTCPLYHQYPWVTCSASMIRTLMQSPPASGSEEENDGS